MYEIKKGPHIRRHTDPIKGVIKVVIKSDMYKSTVKISEMVQKIVKDNYEPERHDRCKLWVYRNKVAPVLGMSERTFWRMLKVPKANALNKEKREILLFDIDEFLVQ